MPAEEARVSQIIGFGDGVFVEFPVMRMHELDVMETLVFRNKAVANDLHLGLVRDRFQIGVEDAALCVESFAVAVRLGVGIESSGKVILRFGGQGGLPFQNDHLRLVQSVTDLGEFIV